MSLKLNERYPARFNNPTAGYPQGSFKNRTTPTAKDGSYLEKDWANDKEGFFQSLLSSAGITANGAVDAVGASQFFDALQALKQIQAGTAFTTAGSAGALTLAPTPAISAYSAPLRFRVKFSQASTGTDTINVSSLGVKNIKQYNSAGAKVAAVFAANQLSDIEYDGTDFVLLDQLPTTIVQRKQSFRGLSKNLKVSANGTSASVVVTSDSVIVANSAGDAQAIGSVSATLNTAVTGSATVDGMAAGVALAVNTWYAVYVWYNSTTGVTRVFGDTSFTTPTAPASGFDMWALVSTFRTDNTPANKFPVTFNQFGVNWRYAPRSGTNLTAPVVLASGNTSATSPSISLALTAVAPPGVAVVSASISAQNGSNAELGVSPIGTWNNPTSPPLLSAGAQATTFAVSIASDKLVLEQANTLYWGSNGAAVAIIFNGFEVPQ
ncbi:hypothetical protein L9Z73_02915 [Pseudomonas sp. TNT11]|uniref:Phage tail protein n=1 Tax=Pseudomonas emilianonis TaxID=2915812 RepID=A0ABT0EC97_9PSED|nr:hypothetical protein [Pseudomonas emilianonis]MCK1783343.1 hypothetical protein [Pseudomonas emilianonis]